MGKMFFSLTQHQKKHRIREMENLLKFGEPNAKLKKMAKSLKLKLKTFTLPAGYTCPGALDCLSFANKETGKITDGKETLFRCFMASAEARSPSLRKMVWNNLRLIEKALRSGVDTVADLICESMPKCDIVRVHVGGDYFTREYLKAWIEVAKRNPNVVFYSYSKSLKFVTEEKFPNNLVLTASRGGKWDWLINEHGLKNAEVVYSEEESEAKGLEIDHDDTHAAFGKGNFALLIHGTQPKGSMASEALQTIKKKEKGKK